MKTYPLAALWNLKANGLGITVANDPDSDGFPIDGDAHLRTAARLQAEGYAKMHHHVTAIRSHALAGMTAARGSLA